MKWIAFSIGIIVVGYIYLNLSLEQRIQQRFTDLDRERCQRVNSKCESGQIESGLCFFMKSMNGCDE